MTVTSADYLLITERPASEASTQRLRMAYLLFLGRIACTEEYFDTLSIKPSQEEVAKIWVCKMVEFLYDNDDAPPDVTGFRLGKFEQKGNDFIDMSKMAYADMLIKNAGLIRRKAYMR